MNIKISISIIILLFISKSQLLFQKNIGKGKEIIIINPDRPISKKEALIILPGFGDKKKRRKKQQKFFGNLGYDFFIPDYHCKF